MNYRRNSSPMRRFSIGEDKQLVVYREEFSGFAEMRIVDSDGDTMPVTMNELLNAISAAYYCQKDSKK